MRTGATSLSPSQDEVVAFLSTAAAYGPDTPSVERIETHGALVFLAGGLVYKIKRAVRFPYMDFSTVELRRRACERELEINRPQAVETYRDLVAITRDSDGRLAIGGAGTPVEWAICMQRFAQSDLLSSLAATGEINRELARDLADAVVTYHRAATVLRLADPIAQLAAVIAEVSEGLSAAASFRASDTDTFARERRRHLATCAGILCRRNEAGHVRRCHGDLHLGNIVMWRGRPTMFDALEFDEALATIDTLYDLAFLLMDLDLRGQRAAANLVLNRYLWRTQEPLDLAALAALPLFLGLRAGIRAMVGAQKVLQLPPSSRDVPDAASRPNSYLAAAIAYLHPLLPCLVAVGGLSGTGKSTLAASLAPLLGPAPGAVHLRSDLERKAQLGVAEAERLPAHSYTAEASRNVYSILAAKARTAVAAGQAVIVDAAFLTAAELDAVSQLASDLGVPFAGLWLTAPEATLLSRVAARTGDASDATPDVVRQQRARHSERVEWITIDAGGSSNRTRQSAIAALKTHDGIELRRRQV